MPHVLFALALATARISPAPQAVEPLVGTLQIDATIDGVDYVNARNARPFAGWVFINGELRGKLPVSQRWLLAPGVYDVRIVVAGREQAGLQYWTARWPRVVIGRGTTIAPEAQRVLARFPSTSTFAAGVEIASTPEPSMRIPNVLLTEARMEHFRKAAFEEFQQKADAFLKDSDFKHVEAARQLIRRQPPARPVIWLEMPPELGGPREFDVDQLRVLQEYLKPDIGGWGVAIPFMPEPLQPESRAFLLKAFDALKEANKRVETYVAETFDEIVGALERSRGR